MTASESVTSLEVSPRRVRSTNRVWNVVLGVWAGITGAAPHVLHHVGPLAGAALLAGVGGQLLFGAVGFVAAIPFLLRLRRRFGNWLAPGIALTIFVVVYTVSTLVAGPLISGGDAGTAGAEADSHAEHHAP